MLGAMGNPRAPVALWNVGLSLSRIPGREREARDTMQRFVDESTALASDPEVSGFRTQASERIAELNARLEGGGASAGPAPSAGEPAAGAGAPSSTSSLSPVGPIVLGAGGAMLIAGAIFGGIAIDQRDEFLSGCDASGTTCPTAYRSWKDEIESLSLASDILLFGGAAVAVTGLILTLLLREESASSPSASLHCGAGGCMAFVRGELR